MWHNRLGALALSIVLGGAAAWAAPPPAAVPPRHGESATDAAKAVEETIEQAADSVSPAVVNILVTRQSGSEAPTEPPQAPGRPRAPNSGSLEEDLREFLEPFRRQGPPARSQSNGAGFIISADGFILTSEHVVRDAVEIDVTLATRKVYRARLVGADPRRDLAVIRIEADGLPVVRLGDAAALRRGQFVLALGSPFGFGRDGQPSLSFGIVSGTGRAIPGIGRELDRYYGNLIQTDAAVNPGNSGGPLVNLDGEVVGVSAVISSQSGASEGVGFAVPITAATRAIIERLKRGEEIVYGFLGVEIQDVTEKEAAQSGAEVGRGAYVAKVLPEMPAEGGLREGDVILAIDGTPIRSPDDVIQVVQAMPVGEKVALEVLRGGKTERIEVEVARRPVPPEVQIARGGWWWRGMRLEPLTDELRVQTGLEPSDRGAFIGEVRDGSPAAQAEIVPGMVIDGVGDKKIASVKEFQAAVQPIEGPCFVHIIGIGVRVIQPPEVKEEPRIQN